MTTTPVWPGQASEPRDNPQAGSPFALASSIVTLVALVTYAGLYATMWAPVALWHNEGWLFLYPVFLAAWVPVGILSATSIGLSIAGSVRHEARRSLAVVSLGVAALLLTASRPALWFGPGPL